MPHAKVMNLISLASQTLSIPLIAFSILKGIGTAGRKRSESNWHCRMERVWFVRLALVVGEYLWHFSALMVVMISSIIALLFSSYAGTEGYGRVGWDQLSVSVPPSPWQPVSSHSRRCCDSCTLGDTLTTWRRVWRRKSRLCERTGREGEPWTSPS